MAYRKPQVTDLVIISDGGRNHGSQGEVVSIRVNFSKVRHFCRAMQIHRELWFKDEDLAIARNTPVVVPKVYTRPLTPVQEAGYKIGQRFITLFDHVGFRKGQIVILHRDDGSDSPVFSGANDCYTCASGGPGAYLDLRNVKPLVETKPIEKEIEMSVEFKVGDKVVVARRDFHGFERSRVGKVGHIERTDDTSLPVLVRFEDGETDWGTFEELDLFNAGGAAVAVKTGTIREKLEAIDKLTAEIRELLG